MNERKCFADFSLYFMSTESDKGNLAINELKPSSHILRATYSIAYIYILNLHLIQNLF